MFYNFKLNNIPFNPVINIKGCCFFVTFYYFIRRIIKNSMSRLSMLILMFLSTFVFSQNKSVISGTVINQENNEPLPFASIVLKNYPIGTISNENGEFDFYIPKSKRNDTIAISFIGFTTYEIPINIAQDEIKIALQPSSNILDEVIVSPLSPLDYIKKALDNLKENYPQEPYQSLAYYREKFIENNEIINKKEGVLKTYYPTPNDTVKNQHQLLLFKQAENPRQFQFMREWIEKKTAKEKKKAIKKGEEINEEDFDGDIKMDLGGPESVIHLDINHNKDNYLVAKHFKKYEYSFGEETSLNGEQIVTINFKAKRKIDYMKDSGKILISRENYAIVLIEATGKASIPLMVKPILFVLGLKIQNPFFTKTVSYQQYKDKWYPKLFRWDANVKLTKRHTFSANENSEINIGQVFFINQIDSVATPISKDKLFDANEDMEDQVHNDINISWNQLNIIKD